MSELGLRQLGGSGGEPWIGQVLTISPPVVGSMDELCSRTLGVNEQTYGRIVELANHDDRTILGYLIDGGDYSVSLKDIRDVRRSLK